MRCLSLLIALLLSACAAPKAVFHFGPTTPLTVGTNHAPLLARGATAAPTKTVTATVGQKPSISPLGIGHAGTAPRARRGNQPTQKITVRRSAPGRANRALGRRAVQRPTGGGMKNINGTALVIGLLGILGAIVAIVALLVSAVTGAAALPWLIVLGLSAVAFIVGIVNI